MGNVTNAHALEHSQNINLCLTLLSFQELPTKAIIDLAMIVHTGILKSVQVVLTINSYCNLNKSSL